jgi:hypothetical protein
MNIKADDLFYDDDDIENLPYIIKCNYLNIYIQKKRLILENINNFINKFKFRYIWVYLKQY